MFTGYQSRLRCSAALGVGIQLAVGAHWVLAAPTTRPTTRRVLNETPEAMAANVAMSKDMLEYGRAIARPEVWADPVARAAAAKTLIPQIHRTEDEANTLGRLDPNLKDVGRTTHQACTVDLAALGEADAIAELQRQRSSADPEVALMGECDLIRVHWRQSGTDPAKQATVAADAYALAKSHNDQDAVFDLLYVMGLHASTPDLRDSLTKSAIAMESPHAKRRRQPKDANAMATLDANVGRPLVLAGNQPDGTPLTTATWKGKVVLIDFWATWCGPCKAELPRVRDAYEKYHADGFEVLGISNDFSAKALTSYTANNKLPWPQLFDPAAAAASQSHPLTKQVGVWGIPIMMLIDRKGVCRSVTARDDLEDQIPKLLSEPG